MDVAPYSQIHADLVQAGIIQAELDDRSVSTAISLLVDCSGSMGHIARAVEQSVRNLLSGLQKNKGEAPINLALFDHNYDVIYNKKDIHSIDPSKFTYQVRGGTHLYDAIERAIADMEKQLASAKKGAKPERVVVVLLTDGEDTSCSNEWEKNQREEKIKKLVEAKTAQGWDFILVGAMDNTMEMADNLGFAKEKSAVFLAQKAAEAFSVIEKLLNGAREDELLKIDDQARTLMLGQ